MIPLGPVVARSRLRAARTAAWTYLADADRRAEWWPELRLDPRVGGDITERWSEEIEGELVSRDASGTVDVWVDGHAIGFTWREAGDFRDTAVLLTLRSQGQDTGITITETGFDALPDSADRAAASQDGWQVLLRDLTTAIEHAVAAGLLSAGPGTEDAVAAQVAGADVLHGGAAVAPAGEADEGSARLRPLTQLMPLTLTKLQRLAPLARLALMNLARLTPMKLMSRRNRLLARLTPRPRPRPTPTPTPTLRPRERSTVPLLTPTPTPALQTPARLTPARLTPALLTPAQQIPPRSLQVTLRKGTTTRLTRSGQQLRIWPRPKSPPSKTPRSRWRRTPRARKSPTSSPSRAQNQQWMTLRTLQSSTSMR
ncbi:SRPBCC domain-containing protein [Leucobacter luti]|uniref:SRPBCC family protein n=1 Tax=Leucobacter luti TaxID=340320 RepID=UPI001C690F4C|nr:SRPBCC domain-containing protein [Leucobacter luti]QYM75244.1 SRPBCC domain-containing protein [Leucobacter luti]